MIDEKIAAALTSETVTAPELAKLVQEVEQAIEVANQDAAAARAKALDPAATINAAQAATEITTAFLTRDRLVAALPQLKTKHQQAWDRERHAIWQKNYDAIMARRDALATELAETYPKLVYTLADLFKKIAVVDKAVDAINSTAPNSESRRLLGVELHARGLTRFTAEKPSIMTTVLLPHPQHTASKSWPPAETPLAVQVVNSMAPIPHPGADWHEALAKRDAERRKEGQRVADYYAERAKEKEEQENAARKNGSLP